MANTKNRFQLTLIKKDKNKTLKIIILFCCQTLCNCAPYNAKGLNSCASQMGGCGKAPSCRAIMFFSVCFFFQKKNCHFNTIQFKFGTFRAVVLNLFFGPEPNFEPQGLQELQPNKRKISISLVRLLQVFILLSS